MLRPARERFSVLVPEEGETQDLPFQDGAGALYRARDGRAAFVVTWATGTTYGESDAEAINQSVAVLLQSFGIMFNPRNEGGQPSAAPCESQNEKDISMLGFAGIEFDISSCPVPVRARVFTRITNNQRQMYAAVVLYKEDSNVARFINSFTITEARPQKGTKTAKTR